MLLDDEASLRLGFLRQSACRFACTVTQVSGGTCNLFCLRPGTAQNGTQRKRTIGTELQLA